MTPPDDTYSEMETSRNNLWYISVHKLGTDTHRLWKHNNGKLKSVLPIGRSKIKCGVVVVVGGESVLNQYSFNNNDHQDTTHAKY